MQRDQLINIRLDRGKLSTNRHKRAWVDKSLGHLLEITPISIIFLAPIHVPCLTTFFVNRFDRAWILVTRIGVDSF